MSVVLNLNRHLVGGLTQNSRYDFYDSGSIVRSKIFSVSTFDPDEVKAINPKKISEEVGRKAVVLHKLLTTLLIKRKETEESVSLKKRVGVAAAVLLNLANQELNMYSAKMGVMLIACGMLFLKYFTYLMTNEEELINLCNINN